MELTPREKDKLLLFTAARLSGAGALPTLAVSVFGTLLLMTCAAATSLPLAQRYVLF